MNFLKKLIKQILFKFQVVRKIQFCEFHYFPFDPLLPLSNGAYKTMSHGCSLLDNGKVSYRLTDGTALGLYRQGEFIKHDNDIDVDVFDVTQAQVNILIRDFVKNGYIVGRIAIYEERIQQVVFYDRDNVIFDIVVWYKKQNEYINNSERGFVRSQPNKYFSDLTNWEFKGDSYHLPGHLDEWMVMRYGPDWQTPKTYKGDWKDDCFDIKKCE